LEGWKTMQIEYRAWLELGELKKFPERASFNEVIKFLINYYNNTEDAKELLK